MEAEPALCDRLRLLEMELHQPESRTNALRLQQLLHEEFVEIGRSGTRYDRAAIISALLTEQSTDIIWSQDFQATRLDGQLALLTYRTALIDAEGQAHRHSWRSSLWHYDGKGWRIRFHQGTPAPLFTLDR